MPTAVNVLASGAYVYVTAYDSSVTPNVGYVFGFSVGSGGVLTPLSGSPFAAGVKPSAIASDATSAYVYVTDFSSGNVRGYTVASGTLDAPRRQPLPRRQPALRHRRRSFLSVCLCGQLARRNVTAYSISNGALTRIGTYATGLQPVAIGIDPSTNHFLYTVNFLDNTVSGFELSTTAGTLLDSQILSLRDQRPTNRRCGIPHNGTGGGIQP